MRVLAGVVSHRLSIQEFSEGPLRSAITPAMEGVPALSNPETVAVKSQTTVHSVLASILSSV